MGKLSVGDQAPNFEGLTDDGKKVKLSSWRGKRLILYFYPKDSTPGCTQQACDFRDRFEQFEKSGADVVGVSSDSPESHQRFRQKHNLPFTLLVDKDHQIAEAYGAWDKRTMFGKKYMGTIRSHFVIDEAGKIVDAQYKVKAGKSADLALNAISESSQ